MSDSQRAHLSALAIGRSVSLETRAKLSAASKGKPKSPEHRAKIAAALFGRTGTKWTPEQRAKLSAARTGHPVSVETRAKISAAHKGRSRSPEMRAKISATLMGRKRKPFTAETIARMSAAQRGKTSPAKKAQAAKLRAANLGRRQSPEEIARRIESRRGYRHSPEVRAKMSAIVKQQIAEGKRCLPGYVKYTKLAQKLHAYLSSRGFTVEPEVRFGRYTVDLYDREHHVAHEADGTFWHDKIEKRRPGSDARRDEYLHEKFGLPVMRYSDTEIGYLTL